VTAATPSNPLAVPATKGSFYISSLDGIRALSFLLVFLGHAGLGSLIPGGFGVTVFFFLSGFLITTLLRMEHDRNGHISLKQFYLRRLLRIFPPFYLVLAVAVALTLMGVLQSTVHLTPVAAQALHFTNYYIIHTGGAEQLHGTVPYWSLAVEEHFYLAFPLLYLLLRRYLPSVNRQMMVLSAICGAILIWRCFLVFIFQVAEDKTYMSTDTRVDSILFGCILAIYGNPVFDRTRLSERWWKFLLFPLGLALLIFTFIFRDPMFRETFRYTLQGLGLMPLFVVAIRWCDWGPFKLLNYRWVKFLGLLSYSMYLMHQVILYGIAERTSFHPFIQGAIALLASVLLASAIYYAVEQPCARLRKRLAEAGISRAPRVGQVRPTGGPSPRVVGVESLRGPEPDAPAGRDSGLLGGVGLRVKSG
jgi:peptidoglycan/LPS O-acetylase OafA/YrhL